MVICFFIPDEDRINKASGNSEHGITVWRILEWKPETQLGQGQQKSVKGVESKDGRLFPLYKGESLSNPEGVEKIIVEVIKYGYI